MNLGIAASVGRMHWVITMDNFLRFILTASMLGFLAGLTFGLWVGIWASWTLGKM